MTDSTKMLGRQNPPASKVDPSAYPANADLIELLCEAILEREIEDPEFLETNDGVHSISYWAARLVNSDEFRNLFLRKHGLPTRDTHFVRNADYRTPSLSPLKTPARVFLTGSCLMDGWQEVLQPAFPNTQFLRQIFNNASELEDISFAEIGSNDFQIVQIPLRSIVIEAEYFSLDMSSVSRTTLETLFKKSVDRLRHNLNAALKYNRLTNVLTFVLNFGRPQANALGFLLPKYDLRNFSYFVSELNRALYEMLEKERSAYLIDYDEITSNLGKRYVQDDISSHSNHGSFIGGTPILDDIGLTPLGNPDDIYGSVKQEATLAIFNECVSCFNILRSDDKIKIVVFDLDGTLWRGVPADSEDFGGHLTEGWPLSILEAAAFLKKRGILLALSSKNDPEEATRIWDRLYGQTFPISNFVSTKFTWSSKVESISQILSETNLLPQNCLFVDDNPVERERIQQAFPDIRVLSGPIFTWRRALLWSAELQTSYISDEPVQRTETTRNMIARASFNANIDEDEYHRQLGVRMELVNITNVDHPRFKRALELLNKTNQFNTTGRRWADYDVDRYFSDGGRFIAVDVADRLSSYGLTALLLHNDNECSQIVMSCRIFGLNVEYTLLEHFFSVIVGDRHILFKGTGKNNLCRLFLERVGLTIPVVENGLDQLTSIWVAHNFVISWRGRAELKLIS